MGSIGGNGATTTFSGNTMNTRVSAGNQLDSLGGGGDWDPYAMIKKLRADKEQARRSAMEWDAKQAQKADWQQNALSAAPQEEVAPDPMTERLRGLEKARAYLNNMENQTPDWYGTRRGGQTGTEMRNLMAAGKIADIDFDNGFETYADIAKGSDRASAEAVKQAGTNSRLV